MIVCREAPTSSLHFALRDGGPVSIACCRSSKGRRCRNGIIDISAAGRLHAPNNCQSRTAPDSARALEYDVLRSSIEQGFKLRFPCQVLEDFRARRNKTRVLEE
jgi:hypothetical protein